MSNFLSLYREYFPTFEFNFSFVGKFSRLDNLGVLSKGASLPLCIYAPFDTKKVREFVCSVRMAMGSQKQTMKTSRGYASTAG